MRAVLGDRISTTSSGGSVNFASIPVIGSDGLCEINPKPQHASSP